MLLKGFCFLCLIEVNRAIVPIPFWSAPSLNGSKPFAGLPLLRNVTNEILFYGTAEQGDYNHGAMIAYHEGFVTVSWKNGVGMSTEDAPGQRVRFTQTTDGITWATPNILFPSLSSPKFPTALFAGPFAVLNGHLYASATPGQVTKGDAQGSQFCLWPDGIDTRNAGPPGQQQPVGVLLLRRIFDGTGKLGPVFWAANHTPAGFEPVSVGVLTANETDEETQTDLFSSGFTPSLPSLPCSDPATGGTLKCEACLHGCQYYENLTSFPRGTSGIANERSHWVVPASNREWGGGDVLVYRSSSSSESVLLSSFRPSGQRQWSTGAAANVTNFPNDNSNINAGTLADSGGGGVFLVQNALPHSIRDPLVLSLSQDGFNFSRAFAIVSCTQLASLRSTCSGRLGKNGQGPSYPQALTVIDPAPSGLQGMWVVSTNNKEDVLLSRFPHEVLLE